MAKRKRKRKSLVCQHLENISREALNDFQSIIRGYVRKRHGVYALYKGQRLYYVGLAQNLQGRVKHHLKDKHAGKWDRFSMYLTIGDSHIKELESLVLRITRPKGNTQAGRFAKSEDLKKRLRKDLQRDLEDKLKDSLGIRRGKADAVSIAGKNRDGPRPALLGLRHGSYTIRTRYKGTMYRARVRADGRIKYQGKLFDSPSDAGRAVRSGKATNGWAFWHCERAPGDWVRIRELRS